jgi:hypothetical protein
MIESMTEEVETKARDAERKYLYTHKIKVKTHHILYILLPDNNRIIY